MIDFLKYKCYNYSRIFGQFCPCKLFEDKAMNSMEKDAKMAVEDLRDEETDLEAGFQDVADILDYLEAHPENGMVLLGITEVELSRWKTVYW